MSIKKIQILTPIVTSLNGENGDVEVNMDNLGITAELAKKSDKNHTHKYAKSDEENGPATSAEKLTTDAGASNKPVYFKNGVPMALPYTINTDVPADAIFTDTTYGIGNNTTAGIAKLYDSVGTNSDGAMTQSATQSLFKGKATTSKAVTATLLAANWTGDAAPYEYRLTVEGVTFTSNQEILPAVDITWKQLIGLQGANMIDGGQNTDTIILKAMKNKPTVDIPIRIILRGDTVTPPVKGDLINMDLDGNGNKQYRVLKMDGSVALCLAMYNSSTSTGWGDYISDNCLVTIGGKAVPKYQDNDLDVYLNTTWYNTLSSTAKSAIVPRTISQDAWYDNSDAGDPDYVGTYGADVPGKYSYIISKHSGSVEIGERNVFALGVQDIIDYLNDENMRIDKTAIFCNQNIWKMFWDTETKPIASNLPWLRSVQMGSYSNSNALIISSTDGAISHLMTNYNFGGVVVRPAFHIDLSKIPFTKA